MLGNGQLGRQVANADGVALLVLCLPDTYIDQITERLFYSLRDAEVAGITQDADVDNNALAWEHVKDFYAEAGDGAPLHVLLLENATTLVNLFTVSSDANVALQSFLQEKKGVVRLLAVALNPVVAEAALASGVTADLLAAVPLAQTFAAAEFIRFRPVDVVLEGRAFNASAAAAYDLRTLNANSVAVTIGRDAVRVAELVDAGITVASKYANVGTVLGRLSAIPVQRSIGRVRSGAIAGLRQASLSGGALVTSLLDTALDVLTDKAYIFPLVHPGKDGFFFNDDPTCAPATDDYAFIKDSRVIKKAARIARAIYLDELLDDVSVDPTSGKLPAIEIARFQNVLENAIETQMVVTGEAVAVSVFVDPNQNVTATDKIKAVVRITKKATARTIEATVEFFNPFNS
ncbi:hypothetical protein GCM10023185_15530 [Hymenobacter saemangeumensis]|uniref:DUF2586 family protein n=2 Tax=Hymenobacter saemangeumensis TaxID=1084522 RepID=A0ABP8I9V5_9BACT